MPISGHERKENTSFVSWPYRAPTRKGPHESNPVGLCACSHDRAHQLWLWRQEPGRRGGGRQPGLHPVQSAAQPHPANWRKCSLQVRLHGERGDLPRPDRDSLRVERLKHQDSSPGDAGGVESHHPPEQYRSVLDTTDVSSGNVHHHEPTGEAG